MPNLWTYEQKFNDLADGPLPGKDNFVGSDGVVVTTDVAARYEGDKGVKNTPVGNIGVLRPITPIESGTVYFSLKATETDLNFPAFYLRNENDDIEEIEIRLADTGKIEYFDRIANDWVQVGAFTYSANVWVRIGIRFRCSGAAAYEGLAERTFEININNGAWAGPCPFSRIDGTGIAKIVVAFESHADEYNYLDYISPDYVFIPPTTPKLNLDPILPQPMYPQALRVSGRVGYAYIIRQYGAVRRYYKYYKPPTTKYPEQYPAQHKFAYAVFYWQGFSDAAKQFYNNKRYPNVMSGYNRYIHYYMLS